MQAQLELHAGDQTNISYIPQSHGFAFSYTGLEMVLLGRSTHLGNFQQPSHEEMELAKAMTVADEALMLNRKGEFFYGTAAEVLNEKNISYSFDVQVVVNEFQHESRTIRSIVPVALQEETA